ncbi:MAG TPA: hypothetical protein PL035_04380, partial [Bacillota bacterium]|nr:hypothetical protein [Bacillota bacterium]
MGECSFIIQITEKELKEAFARSEGSEPKGIRGCAALASLNISGKRNEGEQHSEFRDREGK